MSRRRGLAWRRCMILGCSIAAASACGDDGREAGSGGGATAASAGGEGPSSTGAGGAAGNPTEVDLAGAVDAEGEGSATATMTVDGELSLLLRLGGVERILEIDVAHEGSIAVTLEASPSSTGVDVGEPPAPPLAHAGGHWVRPRPVGTSDAVLHLSGEGTVTVTAWARGAPVPAARRERSLAWTEDAILDDPTIVGAGRVLAAASDDGHGGRLLDAWFRRFATTVHSERASPAQLMDQLADELGSDPSQWDLDRLPFRVTGVHNRLDLAPRHGACGELRVSFGSTDPIVAPLHALFLFRQVERADDVAPDGTLHCLGTARRWARLSHLDGAEFADAARAWLAEGLRRDAFLLAETVELTVSPWEWRQWAPVAPDMLDNPPLFQTVATPFLNQPGALRDDFLGFVAERAASLAAREEPIPERFRSPSAQVPPSVPAERLSLEGLDAGTLEAYPDLARRIEIVGCPTCHTENAEFVQTSLERELSPFYDAELDARGDRLDRQGAGVAVEVPPFGPLQE